VGVAGTAARPQSTETKPARSPRASLASAKLNLAGEDRLQLIAEAAYFRAEQRGFQPGQELEDWLAAELEIDALLGEDDGRA
jgi:hypothetical protein